MLCLKKIITTVSVVVIMQLEVGESRQFSPNIMPKASDDQLEYFVSYICEDFFVKTLPFDTSMEVLNKQTEYCMHNFFGSKNTKLPPPSKIQDWCRTKHTVHFKIKPLDKWQLVILIPDNENLFIEHKLINVSESSGKFTSETNYNSTIWTTVLNDDGTSSFWLQGPTISPWSDKIEKLSCKDNNITVDIEKPTFAYRPGSRLVDVTFNWNLSKEPNYETTVEVINYCYIANFINGNYTKKTLKTDIRGTTFSEMVMDTDCKFTLFLNGNKYVRIYNTPSCYDYILQGCLPEPEQPDDLNLEATETIDDLGWDVEVSWSPPKHIPEKYNVTLRAGSVYYYSVSGNATGVTFYNVKGSGTYNVTVDAIANGFRNRNFRRDYFPENLAKSSLMFVMAGTWCALLAVAAILAGATVWWRRRKAHALRNMYFQDPLQKISKDCSADCGPESGMEDGWEVRSERLLLHEVIGEGAFGVVRRGTLAPGGKEVAVKMLKDFPSQEEIRSFRAEMELMKSVGAHPHIVSLVGCCSGRRNPLIVAEYCSRGDLLTYLRCCWDVMVSKRNAKYYNNNLETSDYRIDLIKKPQKENSKLVVNKLYDLQEICDAELTSLDLLSFCRQIAMGMEFLASNRVVHRDLAARNVLVTSDRMLKIADFGLSRDVYQENQYKQKGNGKMPVKWMALESLTHRIYTTQSDVWSFGVVVWEVVTVGGAPYPEVPAARLPRLLRAGYRMPRPNNCSKQLYELMMSCWRSRPRDRPTFSELHRKLDELLNSACADEYLSLELDGDEAPQTPKAQRYLRMILRGNRGKARGESYERPLKAPQSNHYTSPPAVAPLVKVQPV